MSKAPGRDQREPMERLVRIAAVLRAKGEAGESGERLAQVAGFTGEDRIDQLKRELRHLGRQGWQIQNVAPAGEHAHYRMTAVDNRLRVRLSDAQQSALRRAVLLANRADLAAKLGLPADQAPREVEEIAAAVPVAGASDALSVVVRAVRTSALLRFTYKGAPRAVHPESLRTQNGTWYLRGVEDAGSGAGPEGPVKSFVVGRMSDLSVDRPGTAQRPTPERHPGLHPMSWEIDPPVDVTLETTPDYAPDVRRWLGDPASEEREGDVVTMTYRVTHRAALRARLYELGRRVRLVGPEEVRADLIAELRSLAGIRDES